MPRIRFDRRWLAATVVLAAACSDQQPTAANPSAIDPGGRSVVQTVDCVASIRSATVSCGAPAASGANRLIIGGQGTNVRVASFSVRAEDGIFAFDVRVQNLFREAIGTPNGEVVDTAGIKVFFASGPTVTAGSGNVAVANADGARPFTTAQPQPYFRYSGMLAKDASTPTKRWQIAYDPGVESFAFTLYVAAEVQPFLVINEIMTDPADTLFETTGEWFEVYNAGTFPVQMQGMFLANLTSSGRSPFRKITSPLLVQPGEYVVLGNSTDRASNGGAPVDYAYGTDFSLGSTTQGFVMVARQFGADTVSVDRVQSTRAYEPGGEGFSRELSDPMTDFNANYGEAPWAYAPASAVYGPGGHGTPGARNTNATF